MVKGKNNSKETTDDLTKIDELSQFHHDDDSLINSKFEAFSDNFDRPDEKIAEEAPEIFAAFVDEESLNPDELIPGIPTLEQEEETPAEIFEEVLEETLEDTGEETIEGTSKEFPHDFHPDFVETEIEAVVEVAEPEEDLFIKAPEKFDDIKHFAQNFTHGKISAGGNPPYSIILRNIKFQDDAEDIIELLKEFEVINAADEKEMRRAIQLGTLLIPQLSEYCAIILSHKLRHYDLDIEAGLSDEIHPPQLSESNPRGLLTKSGLKQNKSEQLKAINVNIRPKDVLVSTSNSIPHFFIENYLGVQTTFATIDESELKRLQHIQKNDREQLPIYEYENLTEDSDLTAEEAFRNYLHSFSIIYEDLINQLKQKAFSQDANALLGLRFQLSPISFDYSGRHTQAYHITCSATLANLSEENP